MNLKNYDDYDLYDEDYTGQPSDDDQSLVVPRRGLEPDTGPDDDPMTVQRRGSPSDTDSFVSEEDMDEYPDEYSDDGDELDTFILPYPTGSKLGKKKRKKKHKKKSKKKSGAPSKGVDILKLAASMEGDDEDVQLTDDEQKPPAKGRLRQPGLCQMEEDLLEKAGFIYRKTVLYYYNGQYYEPIDAEGVIALYRQYISPGLDGVKNLRNHMDIYKCLKADPRLKCEDATYKGCICYNKSHSDGYLTQKRIKNLDESSYIYVKGDFEPLVSEEMWERCQQILASRSARVIDENGKKHKYMRNTPKSVWTAKLRCSCGAGFIQFKWRVNRDGAVIHGFQCYRRTRRPSISYLQEHGLDLSISCQIKAISEWKLDLMAAKVFEHLTFDKGKTVKEVYKILSRCMAEEKTVRISRKTMLEKSIAKQRERLDKYIDLCADGIITKQELMERRKGLDNQIADLQSQYESVEQEDERSGALDMKLISQKLDEWQRASKNDVDRELINSCVAQITPLTNEEFRWALDFQMSEVQARNAAAYTMDGFVEMARFSISFEEAKAFKASRNQGIRKNEWQDLTVVVGIWSKTQK